MSNLRRYKIINNSKFAIVLLLILIFLWIFLGRFIEVERRRQPIRKIHLTADLHATRDNIVKFIPVGTSTSEALRFLNNDEFDTTIEDGEIIAFKAVRFSLYSYTIKMPIKNMRVYDVKVSRMKEGSL